MSGRRRLPDAVWQSRCLPDSLADAASGRHLWQTVWQTVFGRQCLADSFWQVRRLADSVCKTVSARCRLSGGHHVCQTPSARRGVCQTASVSRHLTNGVWQTQCLVDGVCQMPSARRPSAKLSGRCHLAGTVLQMLSARRCLNWSEYEGKAWERGYLRLDMRLADGVWLPDLPEAVCQMASRFTLQLV